MGYSKARREKKYINASDSRRICREETRYKNNAASTQAAHVCQHSFFRSSSEEKGDAVRIFTNLRICIKPCRPPTKRRTGPTTFIKPHFAGAKSILLFLEHTNSEIYESVTPIAELLLTGSW